VLQLINVWGGGFIASDFYFFIFIFIFLTEWLGHDMGTFRLSSLAG